MKKAIITVCMAVMAFTGAYSQFTVGPRAGLNVSTINKEKGLLFNDNINYKQGLNAGIFLNYRLSSLFGLQTELLYSQQGYTTQGIGITDISGTPFFDAKFKTSLQYLNVPVLLDYKLGQTGIYLELGPQVGFLLEDNYYADNKKIDNYLKEDKPSTNKIDFSMVGGVGYHFDFGVSVSARYSYGFINAEKEDILSSKNRLFQFALAYDLWSF
jgi:opacity protein-like surface antigen